MLTAKEVLERYRRAEYPEYADVPLTDVNQLSRNGDRLVLLAVEAQQLHRTEDVVIAGIGANNDAFG